MHAFWKKGRLDRDVGGGGSGGQRKNALDHVHGKRQIWATVWRNVGDAVYSQIIFGFPVIVVFIVITHVISVKHTATSSSRFSFRTRTHGQTDELRDAKMKITE